MYISDPVHVTSRTPSGTKRLTIKNRLSHKPRVHSKAAREKNYFPGISSTLLYYIPSRLDDGDFYELEKGS